MYNVIPCIDFNKRTCLEIRRATKYVYYIPMAVDSVMRPHKMPIREFDRTYSPMGDYPVEKAVRHYLNIALNTGANNEVITAFQTVVKLSEHHINKILRQETEEMVSKAKSIKEFEEEIVEVKPVRGRKSKPVVEEEIIEAKPTRGRKAKPVVEEIVEVKPARGRKAKPVTEEEIVEVKPVRGRKPSSGGKLERQPTFSKLVDAFHFYLSEGFTNKEVEERVKEAFPESKVKPGWAAWYRRDLTKKGQLSA